MYYSDNIIQNYIIKINYYRGGDIRVYNYLLYNIHSSYYSTIIVNT